MPEGEKYQEPRYGSMLWYLEPLPEFDRALKKYQKKHRQAVAQMMNNLEKVHEALNLGTKPGNLHSKHIHREPHDVLAIDQRGGKAKTKELRLYVWPCQARSTLYLLTIGEKTRQNEDITWCKRQVERLQKEEPHE